MHTGPTQGRARALITLTAVILILALPAYARRDKSERGDKGPQRVLSVAMNGQLATFKLANGGTLEVPASLVKIAEPGDNAHEGGHAADANAQPAMKQHKRMSLDKLVTLSKASSDSLPAVVSIKYDHDGMIKRARVVVFASSTEATSFLEKAARRRAEMKAAAKPNH